MQHASWRTKIPAVAAMDWPISKGQCPTSGCGKIAIFQSDCSFIQIWWRCYTGR